MKTVLRVLLIVAVAVFLLSYTARHESTEDSSIDEILVASSEEASQNNVEAENVLLSKEELELPETPPGVSIDIYTHPLKEDEYSVSDWLWLDNTRVLIAVQAKDHVRIYEWDMADNRLLRTIDSSLEKLDYLRHAGSSLVSIIKQNTYTKISWLDKEYEIYNSIQYDDTSPYSTPFYSNDYTKRCFIFENKIYIQDAQTNTKQLIHETPEITQEQYESYADINLLNPVGFTPDDSAIICGYDMGTGMGGPSGGGGLLDIYSGEFTELAFGSLYPYGLLSSQEGKILLNTIGAPYTNGEAAIYDLESSKMAHFTIGESVTVKQKSPCFGKQNSLVFH